MNKLGLVLGVAAVAVIAGCRDVNYHKNKKNVQNEVQSVETQPTDTAPVAPVVPPEKDIEVVPVEKHCTCPAGTVHKEPCACGAADCKCRVEAPAPVVPAPVAEETTPYIVQRGDYLAKISKKFNLTISSIKRVNPNMKGDVVRVGETIKLPGKVNVGEQVKPVVAPAVKSPKAAREYKPYTGATVDYKIAKGDSLGLIAHRHGISTRQLKELNGLGSDVVRIGKTLKVPAAKGAEKAAAVEPKKVEKKEAAVKADAVAPQPDKEAVPPAVVAPVADTTVAEKHCTCPEGTVHDLPCPCGASDCKCAVKSVTETKAPEEGPTHVVREGEDLTSLSILYSLSPAEIRSFNNLGENEELKPGQVIKLPADTQL